jgi:hypothetical protein
MIRFQPSLFIMLAAITTVAAGCAKNTPSVTYERSVQASSSRSKADVSARTDSGGSPDAQKSLLLTFDSKSVCNFDDLHQTFSVGSFPCLNADGSPAAPTVLNWNNGDSVIIEATYEDGQLTVGLLKRVVGATPRE